MNLGQVLNSDVRTLGASARAGFAWWTGELRELVPERLRGTGARSRTVAELSADGSAYRLWRDGRPLAGAPPGGKVEVVLPTADVLTRELDWPAVPLADARRMIELELDRLTPFARETVYFDVELLGREPASGRQRLLLGVLPKPSAHQALERAAALGLSADGLAVSDNPAKGPIQFDFLPAIRSEGRGPSRPRRLYWWIAVAALMALNLAVLILKDVNDVRVLRETVEAQRPAAAAGLRLRRTIETERAQRIALLERRARGEPLRALAAVSQALPLGAWVQHFVWNGRGVRIVGFRSESADVLAALRASPVFANARSQATEVDAAAPAGQPFDITADAAPLRPAR
ncbi:MAG TPA: hypothetical protein VF559_02830 [Caulobacteraceae bacterium]